MMMENNGSLRKTPETCLWILWQQVCTLYDDVALHVSCLVKLHVAEVAKNPIELCHNKRVNMNLKKIPKIVTLAYTFIPLKIFHLASSYIPI